MREIRLLTTVVLVASLGSSAMAQSALEGPLAVPDSKLVAPAAPKKAAHHKPSKTAHYRARKTVPSSSAEASPGRAEPPVGPSPLAQPNDPVSFGMKWNGSNDDAKATRVQNYGGDAAGTGAEVGMRLHF